MPEDPDAAVESPARPEGELVAEWLDFEIRSPGRPAKTVRREIFDLIGPAARAAGVPRTLDAERRAQAGPLDGAMSETDIAVLPARLAPEFMTHLMAQGALANRGFLEDVARDPFSKAPANLQQALDSMTSFPGTLYAVAGMRLDASPFRSFVYLDRPAIIAAHGTLPRGGGGDFSVRRSIDIVENGIGVDPAYGQAAALIRLAQGVADTNAEALALRGVADVANTGEAFAAATGSGVEWATLAPGEEARLADLHLPADIAARIAADLRDGKVGRGAAVAAADGSIAGWWRVDPATGETLGMGPNGWGAAMVEYAFILAFQTALAAIECQLAKNVAAGAKATEDKTGLADNLKSFATGAAGAEILTKQEAIVCGLGGFMGGLRNMMTTSLMMRVANGGLLRPSAKPGSSHEGRPARQDPARSRQDPA